MSRLIDAGLLLDHLSGRLESMKDYDAIKDVVNNIPTAYDADKVVEQIYKEQEREFIKNEVAIGDITCSEVIKIVKGGGVDG